MTKHPGYGREFIHPNSFRELEVPSRGDHGAVLRYLDPCLTPLPMHHLANPVPLGLSELVLTTFLYSLIYCSVSEE